MCVIVHQDSAANISKDFARELWKINPDGGGFAYLDDDKTLQMQKHMDFPTFWSNFETARSTHPRRDFMMHMRIATHGSIDITNVHPFQLDAYTIMAHNGIIHEIADELDLDETDDRTDTEVFVREVLSLLPRGWLDNRHIRKMVEEYVGWSRLMFLTNDPMLEHTVYKLGDWDWDMGVHLSNDNHLEVNETQMTGWEAVNMGSSAETSEQWDAWRQYQEGKQARTVYGDNWEPEWELEQLLDALKAERMTMYISHPLILVGDDPLQIECSGCLEEVDVDTAECSCWDMACLACNRYIAYCAMGADCGVEAMVDVDNLTKGDQDELMGMGDNKESQHAKVLAAELAEPW